MRTKIVNRLPNVDDYASIEIQDATGFVHYTIVINASKPPELYVIKGKDYSQRVATINMPLEGEKETP